jgi:Ca2+-binding EF-hand superfamily protein
MDPAAMFTAEKIQSFREVFNMFDVDGDGLISSDELARVFRNIGLDPTPGTNLCGESDGARAAECGRA